MSKFESKVQAGNTMDYEGREYFVTGYTSAENMPDEESKKLFDEAEEKYAEFQEAVEKLAVNLGLAEEL